MLATNQKVVMTLEAEVEKLQREKQVQEKTIKYLTKRMKGNITLLEARCLIWTDIMAEIRKHWKYLTMVYDKKLLVTCLEHSCKKGEQKEKQRSQWIIDTFVI